MWDIPNTWDAKAPMGVEPPSSPPPPVNCHPSSPALFLCFWWRIPPHPPHQSETSDGGCRAHTSLSLKDITTIFVCVLPTFSFGTQRVGVSCGHAETSESNVMLHAADAMPPTAACDVVVFGFPTPSKESPVQKVQPFGTTRWWHSNSEVGLKARIDSRAPVKTVWLCRVGAKRRQDYYFWVLQPLDARLDLLNMSLIDCVDRCKWCPNHFDLIPNLACSEKKSDMEYIRLIADLEDRGPSFSFN